MTVVQVSKKWGREVPSRRASSGVVNTHRLRWSDLPVTIRGEVEETPGACVIEARSEPGGYSPSLAARCRLDDGRCVFVKSCSSDQNPDTPTMMRREAAVSEALPAGFPAPSLLHHLDDGAGSRWSSKRSTGDHHGRRGMTTSSESSSLASRISRESATRAPSTVWTPCRSGWPAPSVDDERSRPARPRRAGSATGAVAMSIGWPRSRRRGPSMRPVPRSCIATFELTMCSSGITDVCGSWTAHGRV
jgi:hypothetical protein